MRSFLERNRAVRARALAGDPIVFKVTLSSQESKWDTGELLGKPTKLRGSDFHYFLFEGGDRNIFVEKEREEEEEDALEEKP